jgi:hypothetical protein
VRLALPIDDVPREHRNSSVAPVRPEPAQAPPLPTFCLGNVALVRDRPVRESRRVIAQSHARGLGVANDRIRGPALLERARPMATSRSRKRTRPRTRAEWAALAIPTDAAWAAPPFWMPPGAPCSRRRRGSRDPDAPGRCASFRRKARVRSGPMPAMKASARHGPSRRRAGVSRLREAARDTSPISCERKC